MAMANTPSLNASMRPRFIALALLLARSGSKQLGERVAGRVTSAGFARFEGDSQICRPGIEVGDLALEDDLVRRADIEYGPAVEPTLRAEGMCRQRQRVPSGQRDNRRAEFCERGHVAAHRGQGDDGANTEDLRDPEAVETRFGRPVGVLSHLLDTAHGSACGKAEGTPRTFTVVTLQTFVRQTRVNLVAGRWAYPWSSGDGTEAYWGSLRSVSEQTCSINRVPSWDRADDRRTRTGATSHRRPFRCHRRPGAAQAVAWIVPPLPSGPPPGVPGCRHLP